MRRLPLRAGLTISLLLWQSNAQAAEDSAFDTARWTLNQLTRMEVDDDGHLRLKRDHWEVAAKRPLQPPAGKVQENAARLQELRRQFGPAGSRQHQERPAGQSPLEQLVERLIHETGGRGFGSTSRSNDRAWHRWSSPLLTGSLETEGDHVELLMIEQSGEFRSLRLVDNALATRFLFRTVSGDVVQILRTDAGVQVSSFIGDKTKSLAGHSFAELAQENQDYFRNELQPFLSNVSQLPIDEVLAVDVQQQDSEPSFPPLAFENGELTKAANADVFAPLVRFRLVDGLLRINRFFGNPNVLQQEVEMLRREYKISLERALERLRAQDVPDAQINELQDRMGQWQQALPPQYPLGGRALGRAIEGLIARNQRRQESDGLQRAFKILDSRLGTGSRESSRGGDKYSMRFTNGRVSAEIRHQPDATEIRVRDGAVSIHVREALSATELVVASDTALLAVSQPAGEACSVVLLGGGQIEALRGSSLASVMNAHEGVYREKILPILDRYHISGLDPFRNDVVVAILDRLESGIPKKLDDDALVGKTDAYIFPLLNDPEYLALLSSRVDGGQREAIQSRIEQLLE